MSEVKEVSKEDTSKLESTTDEQAIEQTVKDLQSNWTEYFKTLDEGRLNMLKKEMEDDTFVITIDGKDKKFKRKKITAKNYMKLEVLRGQFQEEKDRMKSAEILFEVYQKAATYYLVDEQGNPMTEEEFNNSEWEYMKLLIDGFNFITLYGIPKS